MAKKIFIDTDIGGDCDDAGALALANIFQNNGLVDIIGMTFTTSSVFGPACIGAINTYYGNQIEIGATDRKHFCDRNVNAFQSELARRFPNRIYEKESDCLKGVRDAVSLIREKLSRERDKSVTFVCIGQLNNVSDLLDSEPDAYSPFSGIELVRKKIDEFVVMGGLFKENGESFPFEAEYNVTSDVPSAINFVKKCPVRIVFSDYKVGCQIKTGASLLDRNDDNHPVTVAYKMFQNKPRESWDLLTLWFAVFGADDLFTVSDEGTVVINGDGTTVFDHDRKSNHFMLRLCNTVEYTQKKLDTTLLKEELYVS